MSKQSQQSNAQQYLHYQACLVAKLYMVTLEHLVQRIHRLACAFH